MTTATAPARGTPALGTIGVPPAYLLPLFARLRLTPAQQALVRVLPQFESISEFCAGRNGDCGEDATLAALHPFDPARWPLTPAGLSALNAEVQSHGWMLSPNGMETIGAIHSYLDLHHFPHQVWWYQEPLAAVALDEIHQALKDYAGIPGHSFILEFAHGGRLPGDEPVVGYHFNCIGGMILGVGYLAADGDNFGNAKGGAATPPFLYSWPDLLNAQIVAAIHITSGPPAAPAPPTSGGGSTPVSTVDVKGLGSGFARFAQAHNLSCVSRDASGQGEHTYARDKNGKASTFASFAPTAEFADGVILYYDEATGEITPTKAPWVAAALWQELDAANAQVTALSKEITRLNQQPPTVVTTSAPADPQHEADARLGKATREWLAAAGMVVDIHGAHLGPEPTAS